MKGYTIKTDVAEYEAVYADNTHGQRTAHIMIRQHTAVPNSTREAYAITTTNTALDALAKLYFCLTQLQALDTATSGTNITTLRASAQPLMNAIPAAYRLTI